MSQNDDIGVTLLRKIRNWTSQECRTELNDALPKLLDNFSSEKSTEIRLQTLHVVCETLLRRHAFHSLEEQLFAQLLPMLESWFTSSLNAVQKSEHKDQLIATDLETLVEILECLVLLIEHLRSLEELTLDMAYSVPTFVLRILKNSFLHCTQSEEIYGGLLELFGDHLNRFYQTSCKLQAELISLLDSVGVCEGVERDVQVLVQTFEGLFELCQVVQALDLKVMVEVWRIYTKLLTRYQETLKQRLDVASVIRYLCQEVKKSAESIRSSQPNGNPQQKEARKALKLASFNMKLIVTLCDKFSGHLGNCIHETTDLMLFLLQLSAPTAGLQEHEEVRQNLTVGIEPLTLYLLNEREFVSCISTSDRFPASYSYSLCLLHMILLDKLPNQDEETFEMWMKSSILSAVFATFSLCCVENLLPCHLSSVMCSGKAQRQVTLYEHVATHLCAFVASLPAKHFHRLEEVLFRSVLSCDWLRACLASDVWCFLARFSTSELCFSHCCLFAKLLGSLETWQSLTISGLHVKTLLGRLVRFLSPSHVASFTERFSKNPALGCFTTLPSSSSYDLTEFLNGNLNTSSCKELFNRLERLLVQLRNKEHPFVPSFDLMNSIVGICSNLPEMCRARLTLGDKLMHLAFEAAALSSKHMKQEHFLQMLCILSDKETANTDLCHLVARIFVRSLSDRHVPPSPLQNSILSRLADVLALTLNGKNYVLREVSLQIFAEFARQTPHEILLPRVFQKCSPSAQKEITSYLEGKIPKGPLHNWEMIAILGEMAKRDIRHLSSGDEAKERQPTKRRKTSDAIKKIPSPVKDHRAFEDALVTLEKAIDELQKLSQGNPCPVDVQRRIEKNVESLQSCFVPRK